eukprot:TRINITY_DN26954_c0_g1_i1.p1 TRINITY_DN26954_c0_g1~~TRINITY_DN26954_c0_g1_i1.p1  ORF type:complete len:239 (-),score=27.38 TRINITY_DN26954_c0_g1_i1:2940-3581(-)
MAVETALALDTVRFLLSSVGGGLVTSKFIAAGSAVCVVGVASTLESASAAVRPSVQDFVAAPPARTDVYIPPAPRTVPLKKPRTKRRVSRGGGDEEGPWEGADGGPPGGPGGFDGGSGGWYRWGDGWRDEFNGWEKQLGALGFAYQLACWLSLTTSLHHALKLCVGMEKGEGAAPGDAVQSTPAFASCASTFGQGIQGREEFLARVQTQLSMC